MTKRLISSFVSLLYVSVALVFGVIHDHHHESAGDPGHDDHCAACQWQIHSNTDVPVCEIAPVVQTVVFPTILAPALVPAKSPYHPYAASRAPPSASA